jgi:hypothetical protein
MMIVALLHLGKGRNDLLRQEPRERRCGMLRSFGFRKDCITGGKVALLRERGERDFDSRVSVNDQSSRGITTPARFVVPEGEPYRLITLSLGQNIPN